MAEYRFPNESDEYRARRNELLEAEVALRSQVEALAAQRRELPLGGRLQDHYRFEQLDANGLVRELAFAELFGSHDTLLLYSMMFGADWDAPCPACTSLVDGFNATYHSVVRTTWGSELVSRPMDNGHPRHVDILWPLWNLLDLTPEGRGDAPIPKQNYEHAYFNEHVLGEQ